MLNQPPDCLNANSSRSLMPKSGPRSTAMSASESSGSESARRRAVNAATSGDSPNAPAPLTSIGMFSASRALAYRHDAVALLPGQNEEVAELAPAGIDLGSDVRRDPVRRPAAAHVSESQLCVSVKTPPATTLLLIRIERRESRRVRRRFLRKSRLEHLVGPLAQARHRSEVHRQREYTSHRSGR